MRSIPGACGKRVLMAGTILGISLVLVSFARYLTGSGSVFGLHPPVPRAPLNLQSSRFSCLESLAGTRHKRRFAVLHGPDWTLESSIEPHCLPDQEVALSVEEGHHFLAHPVMRHIKFWIVRRSEKLYVRIAESSGSEELDDSALDLVTNHKCRTHRSKNCYVQSARIIMSW